MNKRQRDILAQISRISSSRKVKAASGTTKMIALITVFFQLIGSLVFETPRDPNGQDLNLESRFELAWADEFNQGELDYSYWGGHYIWGIDGGYQRDTSFWNMDQVSFDDENLILTVDKREGGPSETGYYSTGIDTSPNHQFFPESTGYEQTRGYFEVRCILPKGAGLNPAFWLIGEGMFTDVTSGVSGCEIDVFETKTDPKKDAKWVGSVYHTVHYGSYEEHHKQEVQGWFYANNPYEEYNTYGLEWSEDSYIFYINGVETARTDFGGICEAPLYLILSVGVDENVFNNTDLPSQFIVDYVRAYQYKA